MIKFTFWFTLAVSMAGNVAATWGHDPRDMVIGALFPVMLVLAEQVFHRAKLESEWGRVPIAVIAGACMIWSAVHLASLGPDNWMRWLIPIAVDALMIYTGFVMLNAKSAPETSPATIPETAPAPSPMTISAPSQDDVETVRGRSEDGVSEMVREPSPRTVRKPSPRRRKTAVAPVVRDAEKDAAIIAAVAAAAGKPSLGIKAIGKELKAGDDYARKVQALAFPQVERTVVSNDSGLG